jgi:hypothetical protein
VLAIPALRQTDTKIEEAVLQALTVAKYRSAHCTGSGQLYSAKQRGCKWYIATPRLKSIVAKNENQNHLQLQHARPKGQRVVPLNCSAPIPAIASY